MTGCVLLAREYVVVASVKNCTTTLQGEASGQIPAGLLVIDIMPGPKSSP